MREPLLSENRFFGRCAALLALLILVPIGLIVGAIVSANRREAEVGFLKDDFLVVSLFEGDPATRAAITEACAGRFDPARPDGTFDEDDGPRRVYGVGRVPMPLGVPAPRFVQRTGADNWGPIYAVFRGPNATDKVRRWAKAGGYDGWDFRLRWSVPAEYRTDPVSFTKGTSVVTLVGFYRDGDSYYLWDGERVHDLTARLTGHVPGPRDRDHYRRYVAWLEGLAQ